MRTLILCVASMLFAQRALAADPPDVAPTLSAYESLPAIEQVAISPLGDKLATVRVNKDARTIVISEVPSGKVLTRLAVGELRLGGVRWASERYLVILTRASGLPYSMRAKNEEEIYWLQGRVYDTVAGTARTFPFQGDGLGEGKQINALVGPIGVRTIDGHDYLTFASPTLTGNRLSPVIARMNLDTGDQTVIMTGERSTNNWLLDERGRMLAIDGYNTDTGAFYVLLGKGVPLTPVYTGKVESAAPSILGFFGGSEEILISAPQNGALRWSRLSIADRKFKDNLPPQQEGQVALKERVGDQVFGGFSVNDDTNYFFFDPAHAELWNKVVQLFAGERIILLGWSDDFTHLLVSVDGPTHGYIAALVDLNSMKSISLRNIFEGVHQEYPTQTIQYKAADGQDVTGYLTLPSREPKTSLPLIVVAHDGPRMRDTASFEFWSQALASQGYAVFRANFRGSSTTVAWSNASKGELAGKMLTDILAGVGSLAASGTIDPARVCIMGTGYGGYMALASVTLLPASSYRCAVSISGFADARSTLRLLRGDFKASESERTLAQMLGASETDDAAVAAVSPIRHVGAMQASVLLIHGRRDSPYPVTQSEDFYDAMKGADKHVEILKPDSENDKMLRADSRKQLVDATVAFLRKNNPPDLP